jgi:hypothetical protein
MTAMYKLRIGKTVYVKVVNVAQKYLDDLMTHITQISYRLWLLDKLKIMLFSMNILDLLL